MEEEEEEDGHLTIGHCLLRQVIEMMRAAWARYKYKVLTRDINVLNVFAIVMEPFTHRASREMSKILQESSFRSSGRTIIEYFIASFSSSVLTSCAIVERF